MDIPIENSGDVAILAIPGDYLDTNNVKAMKEHLLCILKTHTKAVFDLTHVRFVDSSGLGAILSCLRQVNDAGGDLKLCGLSQPVRSLFELVRMHRIIDIYNTKEEALQAFHA
jgi:anti-sigma B factor antagonist